jgi:hypothetical protein
MEAGQGAFARPLWPEGEAADWTSSVHPGWHDRGGAWTFWADWYEGCLTGEPLGAGLLERVALIPPPDWDKGDDHLGGIVEGLYDDYLAASPSGRGRGIARLPPPPQAAAPRREAPHASPALPQALDDLEALIHFQIERLRVKRYRDDEDRDESIRFLGVFSTMADAVQRLRGMVAAEGVPAEAEEVEVAWPGRPARPGGG